MAVSSIGSHGLGPDNMSAGSSIVTASDNPSGLAISQKLTQEQKSYDVGSDNASKAQQAVKTAEGALAGMEKSIQRLQELTVQAANSAVYTTSDLSSMQKEVDSILKDIQSQATGTTFNTQKLLDGNFADKKLATNPDGTGMSIKMADSTLQSLGLDQFDLTKNFDMKTIEDALKKVSDARSSLGAQSNALDSVMAGNRNTSENLTASNANLTDLDVGQYKSDQQKNTLLESYKAFIQKEEEQRKANAEGMFTNL